MIRGVQGERRWIIGSATPPNPIAPDILAPRAPPNLLAYKSHLTLALIEDTLHELHFCPLLYRSVGSSVVRS
jgi:hypothetical protein